ncbi:ABC transporter ATP-binding protein [Roseivirga sp.]|uniref:ABC transporter ATP-binding protein n=1 Tax=Roseivirga sp. TaxID=1964215 RepID=UPI003B52FFD3
MKDSIFKNLSYFGFFYSHLRYRIVVLVVLNILVGVLDGFGLVMFLPLLSLAGNSANPGTEDSVGALDVIPQTITALGLPLSVPVVLAIMTLFFGLKGVARFLSESYRVKLIEYFTRNVRLELIGDLGSLKFKSFVQSDVGRVQNTLTGEVGAVVNASTAFFQAMQQLVLVCVYVSFALALDAKFAALVVTGALATNLLYRRVYKKTRGASYTMTNLTHKLQGYLIQFSGNYKYLKATGTLKQFEQRLKTVAVDVERENRKIGMFNAILLSVKEPLLVLVVSLVIYLQHSVFGESLEPILTSLLFFYRSLTALLSIQNHWNKFVSRTGSLDNMIEFSEYLKSNSENTGTVQLPSFKSVMNLKGLSLNYGDYKILRNIDLEIQKNETVAFVGESGSGKTTLVNVLAGLLPPDGGEFWIDSYNSQDLSIESYQKRVGYITQEPVIFNDSIFNNITFWSERNEANLKKYNNAINKAAIKSFIDQLPDKEESQLGNNGINLSGGQKQRISIARELYKEIDVLIMDEATSALDSQTENEIQSNIDELKGSYTILVVAHRLSTVKNADRIVLLDKGVIKDIGSFDELKNRSEVFQKMLNYQLLESPGE